MTEDHLARIERLEREAHDREILIDEMHTRLEALESKLNRHRHEHELRGEYGL